MAKLFHVNPKTLDVSECKAAQGKCPFGAADKHFTSADAARKQVESKSVSFTGDSPRKIIKDLEDQAAITSEMLEWLQKQKSWTKNEKKVLTLLHDAYKAYDERGRDVLQPLMSRIAGLHFAKEMLNEKEHILLQDLEKLQKRWIGRLL